MKLLKNLKNVLTKIYLQFLATRSTPLPVGTKEFDVWSDSIIELSGQYADRDSMRFALASIMIHADAKHGSLSKKYFIDRLRKSAANQIASQVFQDIKTKQAEAAAKQSEAQPSDGAKKETT